MNPSIVQKHSEHECFNREKKIDKMLKMMRCRSRNDWCCVLPPGSAADAFELLEGDEIVAINGVVMTDYYQGSVMYVINQGVRTGVMELVIRRYPCTGKH